MQVLCRIFFFIIEVHFGPLSTSKEHAPLISRVRDVASLRLTDLRNTVGFNLAGLRYHRTKLEEKERAVELVEAVGAFKKKRSKKKKKEKALQTAIMAL